MRDGVLLIKLNAPPVEGAANRELIDLLANLLDVPKRNISIVSGDRSRTKRVRVDGLTADDVARRLPGSRDD